MSDEKKPRKPWVMVAQFPLKDWEAIEDILREQGRMDLLRHSTLIPEEAYE